MKCVMAMASVIMTGANGLCGLVWGDCKVCESAIVL
jgi:hypothetical protein